MTSSWLAGGALLAALIEGLGWLLTRRRVRRIEAELDELAGRGHDEAPGSGGK